MRAWKLTAVLAVLVLGLYAPTADAQPRPWRFSVGYQYVTPGPYYAPSVAYYQAGFAPYSYPVYPNYGYRTSGVYALPGYPAIYGGSYYYGGLAPAPYGGVYPYYNSGYYLFRGRW